MSSPEPPLSEYQQTVRDFIALLQALRAWRKVINLYYQGRLIGRATVNFAGLMQKSSSPPITLVDHFDDNQNIALWRAANAPPPSSAPVAADPIPITAELAPPAAAPPRTGHRAFPPDPAKPRPIIDWAALCNTPFKLPDRPEPPLGALSPEAMTAGLAALDAIGTAPVPPIQFEAVDLTKLLGPHRVATPRFTDGGFLDGPRRFGTFQDNTPLETAALPSSVAGVPAESAAYGGFSGYGPAILGLPPILQSLTGFGPDPLDGQSPEAAVLNLAGNLAVGAAEGTVNLIPKTAVSLINTIYEGSRLEALGEGGHLTQDDVTQIRATKAIDSTGTIFTPANPVQAVGETFGEFTAPFFLGGAVRSLGRLAVEAADALLSSFTELNAAKAAAKIEPGLIETPKPPAVAPNTTGNLADVWKLPPIERGNAIEDILANTEYSEANGWYRIGAENNRHFPLVDFQQGDTLVSLKTVDTTGSTWLERTQAEIDRIAGTKATVNGNPANVILDLRVQPGGYNAAEPLIEYGKQAGVPVIVKEFK